MLVAIHQPNFFPWIGYFDKIAKADVFIFLDNAQFPKKGGTWINRVQLMNNGQPFWATAPVQRGYSGVQTIEETRVNDAEHWRDRLLRTLQAGYAKAPFFKEAFAFVQPLLRQPTDRIAELNMHAIHQCCTTLGLGHKRFVRASALAVEGEATDRLVALVRAVGGSAYLCGGGAGGYQEDEKFAAAGLDLVYQNFVSPHYPQFGDEFTPGLSLLDALMHVGFEGTMRLLEAVSERRQAS